jgi:hypothetical protein
MLAFMQVAGTFLRLCASVDDGRGSASQCYGRGRVFMSGLAGD